MKFLCLILLSLPAFASVKNVKNSLMNIEKTQEGCLEANTSNAGMKSCLQVAYSSYEFALEEISQDLNSKIEDDNENLEKLIQSSKDWTKYVDSSCALQGMPESGGTNEGLIIINCKTEKIVDRIQELVSIVIHLEL